MAPQTRHSSSTTSKHDSAQNQSPGQNAPKGSPPSSAQAQISRPQAQPNNVPANNTSGHPKPPGASKPDSQSKQPKAQSTDPSQSSKNQTNSANLNSDHFATSSASLSTPKQNTHSNTDSRNLSSSSASQESPGRPLTEVISETFEPFDHQRLVVRPFTEETGRDATFEQELGSLLLDALIETHAWAAARPKYESQLAVQKLEGKISDVIEVEKAQGMSSSSSDSLSASSPSLSTSLVLWPALLFEQTRQRLNDFVVRMKTALAALTSL